MCGTVASNGECPHALAGENGCHELQVDANLNAYKLADRVVVDAGQQRILADGSVLRNDASCLAK